MDFDASSAEPVTAVAEPAFDPESAVAVAEPNVPESGKTTPGMEPGDAALLKELSQTGRSGPSFQAKILEPAARATLEPAVTLPEIPDVQVPGVISGGVPGGVMRGLKSITESLTAPIGAVLAPLGLVGEVTPIAKSVIKAAEVYFAGETAKAGGAEAAHLVEKIQDPEAAAADVAEAATKAVGALGFSASLATHAAPKFSDHPVTFEATTPDGKTIQVETTAGKLADMVNADRPAPKMVDVPPLPAEPAFDPATAKPVEPAFQPDTAQPVASAAPDNAFAAAEVGDEVAHPMVGRTVMVDKRLTTTSPEALVPVTITKVTRRTDTRGGSRMVEVHYSDGSSTSRNAGLQSDGTTIPLNQGVDNAISLAGKLEPEVSKTPSAEVAPPEVQINIQQPDPHPTTGVQAKPYVQVVAKTNDGRGEPMTPAERAQYPTDQEILDSGLPTNTYTLEEVKAAIAKKNAPEPLPKGATATKNAQVDVERAARGLPPVVEPAKRELGVAWDEASKQLDENPDAAKNLVNELRDNPRAVTDTENALLLHRQIELHNEFNRVKDRINDPSVDPAVKAEDQVRFAKLSDDLLELYNVGKQVGTETGRGLNARKTMANEDFSLANMVTERRAAKGGRQLTPEEVSETEALHQKIAETEKAFDEYRRRASELLMKDETPAARKAATSSFVKALATRADAARARIIERLKSGQLSAGIDPGLLKDYAEVGAYHIAKGVEDFGKWSVEMAKEFGEKVQPHLQAIFNRAKQIHDELEAQDPRLKAFKTRKANETARLQAKTEAGDFSKQAPLKPLALDEEALRLKTENERAKQAYQEALVKDRLANRTTPQKVQDWVVKWRRGFLLSGPVTLAKLTSAAVQRLAITPIEELVGAGYSKLLPRIAERAPREGGINATAEAKAITDGLTKGMQDAWDLLRTGKSSLEVLFGKGRDGAVRESDVTPRSIIDFFGQVHGALKSPVKRAEFARSLEKRMAFAIKNGVDASDPMVQTRLMVEAYKDASRSIFLQDNVVVDAYNRVITALSEPKKRLGGKQSTAGKLIATGLKIALPIVRVPTNIVAETIQVATGTITGSARLAGIMRRGVEKLGPDEADLVMRELKKGTIGTAALLIGYFNADKVGGYYQSGQKRGKNDVAFGSMRLFGHDVPSYLLHNPLLEAIQLGATVKRVAESKLSKKDRDPQGLASGLWAGALGLIEEVPFVRQMTETAKMLDSREGGYARGQFVKGLVVPAAVDFAARKLDTDAKGNEIKRNPKTLLQFVETGIPGLRKNVPAKK